MRLPSVLSRAMMDHLGSTYFNQIWNSPDDHGRANFPLLKAAARLKTGSIPVGLSVVGLPTTDKVYAVYRVSVAAFGRFTTFPSHTWLKDSDVLAQDLVQISTYAASGRVIPEGGVWLRYDPLRSSVLVAIDRTYTSMCTGEAYPQLYMTVYFDTTRQTPTITQLFKVGSSGQTPALVNQAIAACVAQYRAGTLVFINGWAYSLDKLPTLFTGDIVQVTCDPDMIGYCELSLDDNETGYYSDRYQEYREILHIPKVLNPNNVTITIDTLSVIVYDPVTGKGVYGHQIDKHALESISHNDFSISRTTLQAFQNSLGTQGTSVRLHIRFPTDPQRLADDVNHLHKLYTLSDGEIKKQLAGLSTHQIAEWKASHLEKSSYLSLLYDFDYLGNDNLLSRYVSAVGYYDVASTLAESIHYYTYKGAQVTISKPARLLGIQCQVIVYCNGRKIPHDLIGITNHNCSFELGFKEGSYVTLGSRIAVYITESGDDVPVLYQPTAQNPTMVTPHDDYQLVKIISYVSPRKTMSGETSKGYKLIPVSPGDYKVTLNPNGSATYKVSANHYNSGFYLVPVCGLTTQVIHLDEMIANKEPLIVSLSMTDTLGHVFPLIGWETMEVYINGWRLIEGVDYTCIPIMGSEGDVLEQVLEVANQEYLDLTSMGNILEVIVHGDQVASLDKGYAISNKLHRTSPPMVWSQSCSRAFVKGRLVERLGEEGNTVFSQDPLADGAPYQLEWTIPYGVKKLMASFSPTDDANLRARIYRVLNLTPPVYPSLVTITDQYALYSPYLARIVSDVSSGDLVIVDEAKDDAFLRQFAPYELFLERDLVLSNNSLLDRRFVTLAAHYTNLSVQDPQQMVLVQRLISLTLLPAQLAIDEVLI